MLTLGGGEIQSRVAGHQLEWVAAPIARHVMPRLALGDVGWPNHGNIALFCYVSINSEITVACPEVVPR